MDKEMMSKMLAKKSASGGMSDMEKDAKMGVVKAMKDMASKAMGEKLHGLKKVSVASDSKEGLSAGLDKAKELLNAHNQEIANDTMDDVDGSEHDLHSMAEEESPEHELAESPEMEASEHPDMSEEEIDAKLAELMKLKEAKKLAK